MRSRVSSSTRFEYCTWRVVPKDARWPFWTLREPLNLWLRRLQVGETAVSRDPPVCSYHLTTAAHHRIPCCRSRPLRHIFIRLYVPRTPQAFHARSPNPRVPVPSTAWAEGPEYLGTYTYLPLLTMISSLYLDA